MVDGLHGEPIRLIKHMNEDSKGQTIQEIVSILQTNENEMRKSRSEDFCRVYGESQFCSAAREYELKNAARINIQMIRMYHFDKSTNRVNFKEIP